VRVLSYKSACRGTNLIKDGAFGLEQSLFGRSKRVDLSSWVEIFGLVPSLLRLIVVP
jgi:hypothetical protein